jgi:hypothetical protein
MSKELKIKKLPDKCQEILNNKDIQMLGNQFKTKSLYKEHTIPNGIGKEFKLEETMKMKKSHDMKWISKTKSKKCVDAI